MTGEMHTPPSAPFSNGTEADAWMAVWCAYCAHDHGVHHVSLVADPDNTCQLIGEAMLGARYDGGQWRWPEAWTPEPPGSFSLPSRMVCGQFTPCTHDACTGDPAPAERGRRVTEVHLEWKAHRP
jgi:hypothetical protein